jgi:flagellar motility protein MotE (MotC chaperone)
MKMVLVVLFLAVVAFVAALAGGLAATGNLNEDSLKRLIPTDKKEAPTLAPVDDIGPLAQMLRDRERQLSEREQTLSEREQQVSARESALEEATNELDQKLVSIQDGLDQLDADQAERVLEVAVSLSEMDPAKAAETLQDFSPDEASTIVRQIKAKDRGAILDEIADTRFRAQLLRSLQERLY